MYFFIFVPYISLAHYHSLSPTAAATPLSSSFPELNIRYGPLAPVLCCYFVPSLFFDSDFFYYYYYLYLYFIPMNSMGIEAADENTRVTLRKAQPGGEQNLFPTALFFFFFFMYRYVLL